MVTDKIWQVNRSVKDKVKALETYEQIFADKLGYNVEHYGKWHVPSKLYYSNQNPKQRIIQNNFFDFQDMTAKFSNVQSFKPLYQPQLDYLLKSNGVEIFYEPGQQLNIMTKMPYTPGPLDPRYVEIGIISMNLHPQQQIYIQKCRWFQF